MGFLTGFFSGFALTTSVLYITIQVHRSNRLDQRSAIRDQTKAINWLASSRGAYDRRLIPADETSPALTPSRPGMKDQLKHQWNEEVRTLARKAYDSRWEDVRDTAVEGWRGVKRFVKRE
ncbi:hypothetical protein BDW59DRAFT_157486 [Aspergillus cavernicola]|uniref:MICOS complex subunit MIC12 n=1 Tax=Aspergillus cavernicola TaxID=176166 RepID=A0ABR4IW65_9EURO